jgi:hypothetical protein
MAVLTSLIRNHSDASWGTFWQQFRCVASFARNCRSLWRLLHACVSMVYHNKYRTVASYVVKYNAVQNCRVSRQKTDDFAIKILAQMNASAARKAQQKAEASAQPEIPVRGCISFLLSSFGGRSIPLCQDLDCKIIGLLPRNSNVLHSIVFYNNEPCPDTLLFPYVPRDPTAMLPRKPCTAQVPLTATDSPLLNKHQMNTVVWGAEAAATSGKYMFGQRPEHWSRNPTFPAEHEVLLEENTWLSMLGM